MVFVPCRMLASSSQVLSTDPCFGRGKGQREGHRAVSPRGSGRCCPHLQSHKMAAWGQEALLLGENSPSARALGREIDLLLY